MRRVAFVLLLLACAPPERLPAVAHAAGDSKTSATIAADRIYGPDSIELKRSAP